MDIIYAMPVVFITKWMVKIDLWSNQREGWYVVHTLDIFFRQIATFIKVCVAFVFGLHSKSINFCKILSKGLKPRNKDHTNFYEDCDLTKKYI